MPSQQPDWTRGAPKWAAVALLGTASVVGLYWSIAHRGSPALPAIVRGSEAQPPEPLPQRIIERPVKPEQIVPGRPGIVSAASPSLAAPPSTETPTLNQLLNINTASADQLESLPGIGPVIAARILEDRRVNGPFGSVDDLRRVRGIGERILETLRPFVAAK